MSKKYTTDDKVVYLSSDEDINKKPRQLYIEGKFRENPTCAMCVKFTYPSKKNNKSIQTNLI